MSHILLCLINNPIYHKAYALHHIVGCTIIQWRREHLSRFPCLDIVQLERIWVFWRKFRITKRYILCIGNVAERIQLSSPWTTKTTGVVYLQLVVVWQCIRQECRREKLEKVALCFVRWCTFECVRIWKWTRFEFPIFTTQTNHIWKLRNLATNGQISCVYILLVGEIVIESLIKHCIRSRGSSIGFGWAWIVLKRSFISCTKIHHIGKFRFIVELHFPRFIINLSWLKLVCIRSGTIGIVIRLFKYRFSIDIESWIGQRKSQFANLTPFVVVCKSNGIELVVGISRCCSLRSI